MVRSLFVWSKDLWNGERGENGDLSTAEYVFANAADDKQKKEWPFCSLYYEEGTADDNEGTPIAFAERTMDWEGSTLQLRTVRCSYPDGNIKDFIFPDPSSISQDYDLRQAGESGQVNYIPLAPVDGVRQGGVSFHVDEIMYMDDGSAEKHREKVKEFLAKQIDAKISGAMGGDSKDAETFESEYSVERINPTVVEGNADVYGAESFASEDFESGNCEMCAETFEACGCEKRADSYEADNPMADDVMIDESSMDTVYPEGDGRITGQSIATADLTPLGSRAEGYEEYEAYDDSISDRQEWKIRQLGGKVKGGMNRSQASDYIKELQGRESGTWRAEDYEANGEIQDVAIEESPMDFVLPEGEGNVIGQSTPTTDFTPLGARAEGFDNVGFAMEGFYPAGDGRVFGDITATADYTPISRAEESPRHMENKKKIASRMMRIPEASRHRRKGSRMGYMPKFGGTAFGAEGVDDHDGYYPTGDGRILGSITPENQYEPFGYNAEEYEADNPMADDVMIDESSMDTVYPEGDGRITGQSIATTDFTPLGSRAESMGGNNFFTGVASAFVVGLIANMMMSKNTNGDAPDDSSEPTENGE